MIVVWVPHRRRPIVFETTREKLAIMATDQSGAATHTGSIPPGVMADDADIAWVILTKDLQSARHFENVQDAVTHYRRETDNLTMPQHSAILAALKLMAEGDEAASG